MKLLTHTQTGSTTMVGNYNVMLNSHNARSTHPLRISMIVSFLSLQEKKAVVEPDSPNLKQEFVRKAFIKPDEVSS